MKILLTGARGQLGHAIQERFAGHEILASDLPELDVSDAAAVDSAVGGQRFDWVLNVAAFTDVDAAESDPDAAFQANERGPQVLAQVTAGHGIPLLHVSTDYVFDGEAGRPYDESDEPRPRTVYGQSKWAGERAVRESNPEHLIVRTAWLYASVGRNFALTMARLGAEREEVRVVDDQEGSPTYAMHLADALRSLVEEDARGLRHVTNKGSASWFELTREIYAALDIRTRVVPVSTSEFPRAAPRPKCSALVSRFGEAAMPSWQDGVRAWALELKGRSAG